MPRLSFSRSPRPDQSPDVEASPASHFSTRFGALQSNVRSMVNGSSIYSQTPAPSNNNTPKAPFLGFLRREPPLPIAVPEHNDGPRAWDDSRSPLQSPHTVGSYARTIVPLQDPREPVTIYARRPSDASLHRHPADVQLDYARGHEGLDPEIQALNDEINGRRRRRHRRRKHHQQNGQWVRRRDERTFCLPFVRGTAAQGKVLACAISSLFLATVLAIYLALALTQKDLGQEVHVLFIMVILGTTIFFCHSLIRLCMLMLHPPEETPRIPSMTGPEGFQPVMPIRVHLVRDEEIGSDEEEDDPSDPLNPPEGDKKLVPPPPAYGLWRSSVRANPDLLHWQRADDPCAMSAMSSRSAPLSRISNRSAPLSRISNRSSPLSRVSNRSGPTSRNGSVSSASGQSVHEYEEDQEEQGPRPPSYASEDGVSYIVEAAPRSTAPASPGVSDIHPAWRPGYTMSEVRPNELPITVPMPAPR